MMGEKLLHLSLFSREFRSNEALIGKRNIDQSLRQVRGEDERENEERNAP